MTNTSQAPDNIDDALADFDKQKEIEQDNKELPTSGMDAWNNIPF